MNLLMVIIGLFSLGALAGIYLLTMVLQTKETPKFVTVIHGVFVVIALTLLIVYSVGRKPSPIESIVLFVMAAGGGFILVYKDITGKKIPKWLAVTHGLLAIAGFTLLLIYTFC